MSASRDPDRLISEFIDDGLTELPDRAYDAVRFEIDHTRQRVGFGPWEFRQISAYARYAVGAAVVGLVAIVGLQLFSLGGLTPKPSPPPTVVLTPVPPTPPPPTASPTVAPTATPRTLLIGGLAALEKGRYVIDPRFLVPVSLTLPSTWEGSANSPYSVDLNRLGGPALSFDIVDNVFTDPCHLNKGVLRPPPGPAPADLANALAKMPGVTVTGPTEGTIGGLAATELTLKIPDSLSGCNPEIAGNYQIWQDRDGSHRWDWPGDKDRIWIVEAGGRRLMITLTNNARTQNGEFSDELQSVLDSLVIGP